MIFLSTEPVATDNNGRTQNITIPSRRSIINSYVDWIISLGFNQSSFPTIDIIQNETIVFSDMTIMTSMEHGVSLQLLIV